ncbi:MAG: MmgE/PrpD family protein [Dehalococcoidia bacterium]|nr:MmgE/PrpD family protein [Dehalococcoidia bacterium]MSQ16774.1 MmgE/PrpD family protein [Dehalococcoidia bacterium]
MDRTTELLSSFACQLSYEDLSPQVVHQVKRTLADTLGCAMGGFTSEPAKIARRMAGMVGGSLPARILGTEHYSAPDMAGFANGVMVRYLDCNDSYFSPGGGHPSDMIAATLALADPLGADGREVITSIVLAYEVFCRLSDQVVGGDFGWDQGMFSGIGAACAAGKIMGLNQEQMGHAISLSVVPNLPLRATRVGELSMWKGCAAASATRAGIFAAQLAQEGMAGPYQPFDGRFGLWEQAVGHPVEIAPFPSSNRAGSRGGHGPAEEFRIAETTFKFFPSQIHTQGPIGLALELRAQVAPSEIASIRIQSYHSAVSSAAEEPEKWDPKTRETADHSIPYLVAVALQDGAVTPASFTTQRIGDPALRPLIAKMTIEENPEFTQRYPAEYNCRIEVTTRAGKPLVAATAYPKGNRRNPLADAEVDTKFRRLASSVLAEAQCDRALELVWSLEQQPSLEELLDALVV